MGAVSYTHLDVYKRQEMYWSSLSVDTEQLYEVTLSKLIGGS